MRCGDCSPCSTLLRCCPPAAFATLRHKLPTPALDAAARRLEQLLAPQAPRSACSPVTLAWALWAFGRLGYRPPRSMLRRADSALRGPAAVALYELEPADLARLVWGLAEAGYYSGEWRGVEGFWCTARMWGLCGWHGVAGDG